MSTPRRFNPDAVILDLAEIEKILKNSSSTDKVAFLRDFDNWVKQRKVTLSELERLKKELDDICLNAKVGKCVGTGISIVGGLAAILGFGLSLSSDESTRSAGKKLSNCGVGVGLLGGATSVASTVIEHKVNRRILNDVELTLEKDLQLTIELIPYFKKSEDLNSLFKQVFDCDVLSDTVENILKVVQGITSLVRQGKYAYEDISRAFASTVDECSWSFHLQYIKRQFRSFGKKAQFVLIEFCENPKVREAVLKICQALNTSPVIFDIAKVSIQIIFRMSGISKPGNSSLIGKLVGEVVKNSHILLRAVSLAVEIMKFVSIAKDLADSESKYSEAVAEVNLYLLKELNAAKLLVNGMNRN